MEAFEASASLSSHNNRSITQQSTGGVSGEGNEVRRGEIEGKMKMYCLCFHATVSAEADGG
jgi:hypothetical protein